MLSYLQNPPALGKYEGLKALLLRTFRLSRCDCTAHLLHMDGLGDRKPSALMSEMFTLKDGHQRCLLFEQAFLDQMPDDICLLLAGPDFADPLQLAEWADELWLAKQQDGGSISWMSAPSHKQPRRDAQPSAAIAAPQPPAGDRGKCQWCNYHQRRGAEARRCRIPCLFPGNASADRQWRLLPWDSHRTLLQRTYEGPFPVLRPDVVTFL